MKVSLILSWSVCKGQTYVSLLVWLLSAVKDLRALSGLERSSLDEGEGGNESGEDGDNLHFDVWFV